MIKGPLSAEILILGEAPGETEVLKQTPFVGASGMELHRMLLESGIDPEQCCFANVCNVRPANNDIGNFFPPSKAKAQAVQAIFVKGHWVTQEILDGLENLQSLLRKLPRLRLIIGCGNTALWAITGNWGIGKWRGSQITSNPTTGSTVAFVPVYHPAAILRQWELRFLTVLDLKRAKKWLDGGLNVPTTAFITNPTFDRTKQVLNDLLCNVERGELLLAVDIETRRTHIMCIGLAWSKRDSICIPFVRGAKNFYSTSEEIFITWLLYQLLTHPNVRVIGQNFLYDMQYFARRLGFQPRFYSDTMLEHHIAFPMLPKGLDFLSSFYNDYHLYWKEESKDWDPSLGETQLWIYNCKDAVATYEAHIHIRSTLSQFNMLSQAEEQLQFSLIAFRMMLKGIRFDLDSRPAVARDLENQMKELETFTHLVVGKPFKLNSPKQVKQLAYEVFRLPPIYKERAKGIRTLSADKEAIEHWCKTAEPIFRPVLEAIRRFRSLQVFLSTFVNANIDPDGRFRCSINTAGTNTFRWSTSEDAFGYGTNMQNIPKGDDE